MKNPLKLNLILLNQVTIRNPVAILLLRSMCLLLFMGKTGCKAVI